MQNLMHTTAVALALLLTGPALAQQSSEPQSAPPQAQTTTPPEAQAPDSQPQAQSQPDQGQQAQLSQQADGVMGKKAMSQQGKEIGSIEDILVGPDGRVQAVIVDHEGKKRAVPWQQVSMKGDQVTVNMNDQQLSQLPEYKAEKD